MSRLNPLQTLAYVAGAAIAAFRICKFDAADGTVIQSAAATDSHIGVSTGLAADTGERVDLYRSGVVQVEFGGNVTRGALLTSDSVGRAIAATASAGSNIRIIGTAEVSGVLGDIGSMDLNPGSFQG